MIVVGLRVCKRGPHVGIWIRIAISRIGLQRPTKFVENQNSNLQSFYWSRWSRKIRIQNRFVDLALESEIGLAEIA